MKAIIDYHYITDINQDQTKILFKGNWHNIIEDQQGEHYFMYEDNSIYFELATDLDN